MLLKTATTFVLTALMAGSVQAQTLAQIVANARTAANRRAQGVENYTVVEATNGVESTLYFEKKMLNGFPMYLTPATAGAARGARGRAGAPPAPQAQPELLSSEQFISRARMAGAEAVDGKRAFKLVVDDLSGMDAFADIVASGRMKPKSMTLFLDATEYVPVKMIMLADVSMGGTPTEVTFTTLMQDYRVVSGVLHPFKRTIVTAGLDQGMTPAQKAQIDQMKAGLASLPPEQRAMAEKMMAGMGGGAGAGGGMEMTTIVTSLKVNTGPPK